MSTSIQAVIRLLERDYPNQRPAPVTATMVALDAIERDQRNATTTYLQAYLFDLIHDGNVEDARIIRDALDLLQRN